VNTLQKRIYSKASVVRSKASNKQQHTQQPLWSDVFGHLPAPQGTSSRKAQTMQMCARQLAEPQQRFKRFASLVRSKACNRQRR
jgi:hypothetical protein